MLKLVNEKLLKISINDLRIGLTRQNNPKHVIERGIEKAMS